MKYFDMVPVWVWEVLVVLALLLAVVFNGKIQYWRGEHHQIALEKALVKKIVPQAKAATQEVEVVYRDKIKEIKGDTITLIKKVPVYVTVKDDSLCRINNGFVSLWNSSNQGQLSNTSEEFNGTTSPVVLSDVAAQHAREAAYTRGLYVKVIGLQNWVMKVQAIYNKKDP